MGVLDGKF